MLRHIDIQPFLESRKEFVKKRQAEIKNETGLDQYIIMHIGLISTIICFLLQLCAVIFGTVFYDQQQKILLSVLCLLLFPIYKYIFGGFGGNGNSINTIKLILGLFSLWVYSKLPDFYNFAFDWFNDSLLSKIEVWAFFVLTGLMLGISLATYVKAIGESSLSYNRFVAGFNAGAAIAFSILLLICSNRDKIVHSSNYTASSTETVEVASSSSDIEEAVEVVEETSPEMEAVKDLYRIFYYKDDAIYGSNSKHMKERFEEYGISSTIQNPYTPSLQAEIDRMEALTQEVGDLSFGFDSDILHFGQGDIVDLNLGVYDVTKIDENTFSIRTHYHNMEDYERTFVMKKIDGSFKIDDMDNIRAFIKEECAKAREYLKERGNVEVADNGNFKFSGKIGKSPIVVQLAIDGEKVTGKYAYQSTLNKYGDEPGSYFYLSGNVDETGTMNLVSKMHKSNDIFEYITLPSTAFNTGSVISGELKNANNGDSFPIELHME